MSTPETFKKQDHSSTFKLIELLLSNDNIASKKLYEKDFKMLLEYYQSFRSRNLKKAQRLKSNLGNVEKKGTSKMKNINSYSNRQLDLVIKLLDQLLQQLHPKYILISGSYNQSKQMDELCEYLGVKLIEKDIGVISAGNKPGFQISQAIMEYLDKHNLYNNDKVIFYKRRKESTPDSQQIFGTVKYYGFDHDELREEMIKQATVLVVIGGSLGTKREVAIAKRFQVPVIPLAVTGATAREIWKNNLKDLDDLMIDGEFLDKKVYACLNNSNKYLAADAALQIILKILKR